VIPSISGNYEAESSFSAQTAPGTTAFDRKHPIFHGIKNFREGTSSSQVRCNGVLKHVCLDSAKGVLTAVRNKEGQGRAHCCLLRNSRLSSKTISSASPVRAVWDLIWLAGVDGS